MIETEEGSHSVHF